MDVSREGTGWVREMDVSREGTGWVPRIYLYPAPKKDDRARGLFFWHGPGVVGA